MDGVREGYSGGYTSDGSGFEATVDDGDIYYELDRVLGTHSEGGAHVKYAEGVLEYKITGLQVTIQNAPLAPSDPQNAQRFEADAMVTLAKLIFTSRYIRDAPPEHLQNYVRYISTREGVEKVDESKKNLPVTPAQKDLIRQLLKDMPESKDMLEYEDYRQRPTIGNASEFITQAMERNLDMAAMKENYVDYLANRPRVERIGEHGLFTDEMLQGVCENVAIGEKLRLLSERLQNTRGKKVYGYLKADVKRLVDQIVDELAKDPAVSEAYRAWGEWQDQVLLTYSAKAPPLPPMSGQKQLKSIKNMVIAEALKLGGHHFLFETSSQEDVQTELLDEAEDETVPGVLEEKGEVPAGVEDGIEAEELLAEPETPVREGEKRVRGKAEWNQRYKLARSYLYGSERIPQDFAEAMRLFLLEADSGNALAMYDLGRMWADGLGVEAAPDDEHSRTDWCPVES